MHSRLPFLLALAMAAGSALAQPGGGDPRTLNDEARKVADQLVGQIRGELTRTMEASGPMRAVIVCKYTVPEVTSNLSRKTGWRVTRVAARPRNPALGMADAWELKVLEGFHQRTERGEKPEALEHAEIVTEGGRRYHRYMRALVMAPVCLACHGPVEQISDTVKAQLSNEYPFDTATGYKLGQMRGAITIKRPLAP